MQTTSVVICPVCFTRVATACLLLCQVSSGRGGAAGERRRGCEHGNWRIDAGLQGGGLGCHWSNGERRSRKNGMVASMVACVGVAVADGHDVALAFHLNTVVFSGDLSCPFLTLFVASGACGPACSASRYRHWRCLVNPLPHHHRSPWPLHAAGRCAARAWST